MTQNANILHEFDIRFERIWFEKLTIHIKNAINECLRIFFTHYDNLFDSFIKRSLIINCTLSFNDNEHKLETLIDIDATDYTFIDREIAQLVYNMLNMKSISLLKSKSFIEFDDRQISSIIYIIYFKLTIELHFELIVFLFIIDLNNHSIILKKSWMNKHEIILNKTYDKLIFKSFKTIYSTSQFKFDVWKHLNQIVDKTYLIDVAMSYYRKQVSNAKHIATIKLRYTILSRSKSQLSTLYVQNESNSSNFELFADSKIERDNESFVVEQKSSEVDIAATTKTISCKKRNLKK